eukprot:s5298_g4.t1
MAGDDQIDESTSQELAAEYPGCRAITLHTIMLWSGAIRCRKYWAAWNLRTREVSFWPRAEWWESWPGVLAQCLMVVLILILLMWLCEDVIRGFINRAEVSARSPAARSLIMVESPSKPQHEEPKAEQHAQAYVAYSPMDHTDTDSESEEETEVEAPTQKLQNFHNFQVHDDHRAPHVHIPAWRDAAIRTRPKSS